MMEAVKIPISDQGNVVNVYSMNEESVPDRGKPLRRAHTSFGQLLMNGYDWRNSPLASEGAVSSEAMESSPRPEAQQEHKSVPKTSSGPSNSNPIVPSTGTTVPEQRTGLEGRKTIWAAQDSDTALRWSTVNDATAALVEENRSTIAPATAPPSASEIAMSLATVLHQLVDTKNNNRAPDETSHGIPIQIEVAMKQGIERGVARALELITIPARHTGVLKAHSCENVTEVKKRH